MMSRICKILFFGFFIKPIVLIVLGLNIRNRDKLPIKGPAIIAGNHNSHLDTMVLMSLYPLSKIHKVRPVAAADYFLSNKFIAWFSLNVIGIIPLNRLEATSRNQLFEGCNEALANGDILILFPEGSRGKPEEMVEPKKGIYYLLKEKNDVAITPVVMHGLGRSLPRGEALLVPFNCDVIVGDKIPNTADNANELMQQISRDFKHLLQHCLTRNTLD